MSVLLNRYQEARASNAQPQVLDEPVLRQCQEAACDYAAATRICVKKLDVAKDHSLSQARDNLYALEHQKAEVWKQHKSLPTNTSPEAASKLQQKWNTIAAQVHEAENHVLQLLVSPDEALLKSVTEQKQTTLAQHEVLIQQRQQSS